MPKRRLRRWLAALLVVVLFIGAAGFTLSRVLASGRAKRYLTARLEQAFGRTVEVSGYGFRWLPTPGIVANQVTIGEDARFGQEYFLRAESVSASPRWGALFRGRFELGTIEFSQPSLNLVRNANGRWNVEDWLPPTSASSFPDPSTETRAPKAPVRLSRIEIDGGRINFSRGVDRRSFALTDVTGSIELENPGRWRIALAAQPQRAGVHLQEEETLRVSGVIAGTSARLHPAELELTWSDASLADALRLALGDDPGVRGEIDMQVKAHTEAPAADAAPAPALWKISFNAHVSGLHRWDMPSRADNPELSMRAEGVWQSGSPRADLENLVVEGPRSNISGAGDVDWSQGITPDVRLTSTGIALDDLFAWYRAFQPGVADRLVADGILKGNTEIRGWPVRFEEGQCDSTGAVFRLKGAPLLSSAPIHILFGPGGVVLAPLKWIFPGEAAGSAGNISAASDQAPVRTATDTLTLSARVLAPVKPKSNKVVNSATPVWTFDLGLSGDFAHVERLLAASRTFGRPLNSGWEVAGGASGDLHWQGSVGERFPRATGNLAVQGLEVRLPVVNHPLEIESARVDLKPGVRSITIAGASALGAHWQGTVLRQDAGSQAAAPPPTPADGEDAPPPDLPAWEFDLSADHLNVDEIDRWLGPRARPGWLARLFSSQGSAPAQNSTSGMLEQLRGHGSLRVDEFTLASLEAQKLHAEIDLNGRALKVPKFDAKLEGGTIGGGLRADLNADPAYSLDVTVAIVDAAGLTAASPALQGKLTGQISGDFHLAMHGVGREALLDSLKGEGNISAVRAGIRGLTLSSIELGSTRAGTDTQFSQVSAEFSVSSRNIALKKIALLSGKELFEGSGTADFARTLRIELWPRSQPPGIRRMSASSADPLFRITGALEAPQVISVAASRGSVEPGLSPTRH